MKTELLREARERVAAGGLLAHPTETVWGLGADSRSDQALARLRAWKGRGADQPVSILVESLAQLSSLGFAATPAACRLAEAFWPGPLTLILPCRGRFGAGVARADGAVGVRCSSHPVAAALATDLSRAGVGPLTSTSLNRSGEAPARTLEEARRLCADGPGAPLVLDAPGAPPCAGIPSTVADASGVRVRVLRWGAVGRAALQAALGEEPLS